ncbi:MAG: hypothetical protein WC055_16230 [Melioribacteraceae bacterium]
MKMSILVSNINHRGTKDFSFEVRHKAYARPLAARQTDMNDKIPYIGNLMQNLNIDESVLDAYYNLTPQPSSRDKISDSYIGRLNWYNNPFQYNVFGAYPLKHDYELLEAKIEDNYFAKKQIDKEKINFYLKEYSKGFKIGHDNFENDIVKTKSTLFDDKTDYSRTIFDFATGSLFKGSGFPETFGGNRHVLSGWFEAGKEQGYFYKAWDIILSHSSRFEKYFKKEKETSENEFIDHFIRGIECLYDLDEKSSCIKKQRESNNAKNEHEFRDWFIPWFKAKYDYANSETEKGNRRIDLKIEDNIIGKKIIEFKGWWNGDKKEIIDQLTNYMTEFDKTGYVFMINNLSKGKRGNITKKYEALISKPELNFKSWDEIPHKNTDYKYYKSTHYYFGGEKEIYHFIFRLNK